MHSLHQNVLNPTDQLSKRHLRARKYNVRTSKCNSPVADCNNRHGQCDKIWTLIVN